MRKILQIQTDGQEELESAMYYIFDQYWMPVFSSYRDHKAIEAWSHLMPDYFKVKYTEQALKPWLMVRKERDLEWVRDISNWGFLLSDVNHLFTEWLEEQKRIDKQALDFWLLKADTTSRSQMLLQVKSQLAKNIGKRFKVDPAN